MSNVTTNTVLGLVVGATGAQAALPATPNLLGPGQVGAYKPDGTAADGSEDQFFIARGGVTPGKFMRTDIIDTASKGAYKAAKVGTPAQAQVDYIGFNGVSGDIDVIADNMYYVRLYMQELLGSASDARIVKHAVYNSGSTTTGAIVSLAIAASCNANFSADPEQKVNATVVTDAAAEVAAIADATFTYGQRMVVTAGAHGLSVGDRVRLADGTDLQESTFLVLSVPSATTFEITNVWASATITIDVYQILAANLDGSEVYGVKFIGQPLDWRRGRMFNSIVMWDLNIEDFGTSLITKSVGAHKGNLTGKEVCDLETFAQGYYGEQYRVGQPALFDADAYADPNVDYDGWRFHTVNDEVVGIGATPTSKKEFLITLDKADSASEIAVILGLLVA